MGAGPAAIAARPMRENHPGFPSYLLAGWDLVVQLEAAVAVHLDDPHRLLDVVISGELERPERRLDVHGLHRGAQLVAVAREVAEREVGTLCRVGEDLDRGVALRRELVRVLVVLGLVRAHEIRVRWKRVADVPGARAARAFPGPSGLRRNGRGVEAVTSEELPLPAEVAGGGNDLGGDAAERRDEDHIGLQLDRPRDVLPPARFGPR